MNSTTLVEAAYVVLVAQLGGDFAPGQFVEKARYPTEQEAIKAAAAMRTNDSVFRVLSIDELVIETTAANGP